MNFEEGLKLAFQTIKANKLRSLLTTLGIVIGVMSIIGMMSIINALDRYMTSTLSAIGGNVFWIQKFPAVQMGRLDRKYRLRKDLKIAHAEAISRRATLVATVAVELYEWGQQIKYKDKATNPNIMLYGGDQWWADVNGLNISEGRALTPEDIYHRRNVAIIGADVVDKLFPFSYPVGEAIQVQGVRYEVVGVTEKRGNMLGQSQDGFGLLVDRLSTAPGA